MFSLAPALALKKLDPPEEEQQAEGSAAQDAPQSYYLCLSADNRFAAALALAERLDMFSLPTTTLLTLERTEPCCGYNWVAKQGVSVQCSTSCAYTAKQYWQITGGCQRDSCLDKLMLNRVHVTCSWCQTGGRAPLDYIVMHYDLSLLAQHNDIDQ